ncbi:SAM-dependent methyltransferase [Bacillus altitudinis]|uniref:SAM-dependent methyltransferase n=1 Tax=Bacillus altitudinis TaxID=293387 RepID=UPI00110F29EE|nr:SAM-dependent methyltransferase [Bacillus altitudinis]
MSNLIKETDSIIKYRERIMEFMEVLPYRVPPYNGRNWGHPWHSLCSYHGKLKPSIAYHLISWFTQEGETVLDPMSGVGTIPFEASLQGRIGIGNDLSEMAYSVTKAKIKRPNREKVFELINELDNFIENFKITYTQQQTPYSDFGMNGKLPEYFHPDTFSEILSARQFFLGRIHQFSPEEAFIFSCFLHVLHGNRPYALSRNSHPLTPYAPTGEFIYKNVVEHIKKKVELSFKKGEWGNFKEGQAIFGDLFDLNTKVNNIDTIITSPPFFASIRFYVSNWMRLWLSGWEPDDFKLAEQRFLEGKQKKNLNIYITFFELCYAILKEEGKLILHLGKSDKCDMALELSKFAEPFFTVVHIVNENVENLEKHGISDKGATTDHQFLFLIKKK